MLPDGVIAHCGDHPYFKEAAAQRCARVHVIIFDEPDTDAQYAALRDAYVHLSGRWVRSKPVRQQADPPLRMDGRCPMP